MNMQKFFKSVLECYKQTQFHVLFVRPFGYGLYFLSLNVLGIFLGLFVSFVTLGLIDKVLSAIYDTSEGFFEHDTFIAAVCICSITFAIIWSIGLFLLAYRENVAEFRKLQEKVKTLEDSMSERGILIPEKTDDN